MKGKDRLIVTLEPGADADAVQRQLAGRGLWVRRLQSDRGIQFFVEPGSAHIDPASLSAIAGVAAVAAEPSPHPLVDRHPAAVTAGGVVIGGDAVPVLMAGPCGVESEAQIHGIASRLGPMGVEFLRGGAFKTRTSPYAFQGHGAPALRWLREAADAAGLRVVTEVLAADDAPIVADHADMIQIGSRNMQNSVLLRAASAQDRPILLKRGMSSTIDEWLLAGEYCLAHGAPGVVFCERGIRSFDPRTRNLLDLGAVSMLARVYGVPVVVDPSHATGRRDLIAPLSQAALAAGAGGLLIETHTVPGDSLSDASQALPLDEFEALVTALRPQHAFRGG
jgi:3-deoxy-7-phosphoheptulonate synthase